MLATALNRPGPVEVGLAPVDRAQIRALCDAGYLPVSRYVELAAALGWDAPPAPTQRVRLPPMATQPRRDAPLPMAA